MPLSHTLADASQALANRLVRLAAASSTAPSRGLRQFRQPIAPSFDLDLANWLACQPGAEKFYWRSRDGQHEVAVLGFALRLENAAARQWLASGAPASRPHTYYWISGFSTNADALGPDWDGFPAQLAILPRVELRRLNGQLSLAVALTGGDDPRQVVRILEQLHPVAPASPPAFCLTLNNRQDLPSLPAWCRLLGKARQGLAANRLQKVVLARRTQLDADTPVPFWPLFRAWRSAALNSYQIAVQLSEARGFISFTPERLLLRRGESLTTEALAGTLPLVDQSGHRQPPSIGQVDDKNRHEHALVIQDIRDKLRDWADPVRHSLPTRLLRQRNLQHLYQPLEASLRPGISHARLLAQLHPTAAVGGLPGKQAQAFIAAEEPFERGWYAGCCGPVSGEDAELALTIRSAQVLGPRVLLYAGAGIVPDSDAEREWQELEQKIALPLALLTDTPDAHAPCQERHVSTPASLP